MIATKQLPARGLNNRRSDSLSHQACLLVQEGKLSLFQLNNRDSQILFCLFCAQGGGITPKLTVLPKIQLSNEGRGGWLPPGSLTYFSAKKLFLNVGAPAVGKYFLVKTFAFFHPLSSLFFNFRYLEKVFLRNTLLISICWLAIKPLQPS